MDTNWIIEKLPERPVDANKGTFGKVLIIAGSKNYPGAAILSCLAAARVGAGLITLAADEDVYKVAVPKIPFATFLTLDEVSGNVEKYDAVLIGPGLGMNHESGISKLAKSYMNHGFLDKLNKAKNKLIIDADGLNLLSKNNNWFDVLTRDAILTPHPGEMSRLTGLSIDEIQNKREEVAKEYSNKWNKNIILKGAETVVASPDGNIFKAEFANPLLATAGTGDVLSGMISGFLSQGLNLFDASALGVQIHGMAAEKLKEKFGDTGATALDLVDAIPEIIKNLK